MKAQTKVILIFFLVFRGFREVNRVFDGFIQETHKGVSMIGLMKI
jgi:hypothetical protein